MIKYHKIETPFKRDENGTKKLIENEWRDDTLKFLKNVDFEFTEKIDGCCTSIEWNGHNVEFHGRTENAQIPVPLVNYLTKAFGGDINEELFEQKFGETKVVLFGEGYGPKIQGGGAYRSDVSFILFDVYLPESDIWLKREAVEDIATTFGIDVVPIILTGTIWDAIRFVKTNPNSTFGTAKMEGVVGRPAVELRDRLGRRVITKIKVKDFC